MIGGHIVDDATEDSLTRSKYCHENSVELDRIKSH